VFDETTIPESEEQLILVDEEDIALAPAGKLDAHRTGDLHRAFSVFVFRPDGQVLIQKRADTKYHSPGQWANTCCGHPRPEEDTVAAGERRLGEELGLSCRLQTGFKTRYRAELGNGLVENELVHVLFGVTDAPVFPNPAEASDVRSISLEKLSAGIRQTPDIYAIWIVRYFERHATEIAANWDRMLSHDPRYRRD